MSSFLGGGGGGSSSITINTTPIIGGTTGHILYDNAGTVGEAAALTVNSLGLVVLVDGGGAGGAAATVSFIDSHVGGQSWSQFVVSGGTQDGSLVFLDNTAGAVEFALSPFGQLVARSTGVFGFGSNNNFPGYDNIDTGISRLSASVIAVGNGTAADHSGALNGGSAFFGSDTYANRNTAFGSLQVNSAGAKDGINIQQNGIVAWRLGLRAAADLDQTFYINGLSDTLQTTPALGITPVGIVNLLTGGVLSFNGDTGISRGGAASLNFGNGTAANTSAMLAARALNLTTTLNEQNFVVVNNAFPATAKVVGTTDGNSIAGFTFGPASTAEQWILLMQNSHNFWFLHFDGVSTFALPLQITTLGSAIIGGAAVATNATDGFLYVSTCAGTPTGTPTPFTGTVPLVYDTTNNKLYAYNSNWKAEGNLQINTQTASYVLAISDQEGIVEMNAAGANAVTVPANATVAFPIGTRIMVVQVGAGQTTVQAAAGVTGDNFGALSAQWDAAWLYKRATDEWVMTLG